MCQKKKQMNISIIDSVLHAEELFLQTRTTRGRGDIYWNIWDPKKLEMGPCVTDTQKHKSAFMMSI